MIETNFSRRVAKIMHCPIILKMNVKERINFTNELERARNFKNLAPEYQRIILTAEHQKSLFDKRFILNIDLERD